MRFAVSWPLAPRARSSLRRGALPDALLRVAHCRSVAMSPSSLGKDPLQLTLTLTLTRTRTLDASRYRDTLEMHAQQIGQMQETQQLILQELHQVTSLLRAQGGTV